MADDFGMGYALGADSGGGNGGMFGGDGWIGLLLFAMIFGGGWGGGGFGGGGGALTRAELHDGFAIQNIDGGIRSLTAQVANCCCENREAISQVRFDLATQSCETRRAIEDSTRAILDFLTQDKISTLQSENQTLRFQASQVAQNQFITQVGSDIVNRLQPPPVPAYQVANPYVGYGWYGSHCGSGYNSGCGCVCC